MKTLSAILTVCAAALLSVPAWAASHAAGDPKATCEKSAADKKLAGAAKASHIKKCMADAGGMAKPVAGGGMVKPDAACEKSADDKKLAGAARTSHMKKCMADAKTKKS